MSNSHLVHHNLIDLLNDRHQLMRETLEITWNNHRDIPISNTEWYILSKVYQSYRTPLSKITKHVSISRQAIHKQVKSLEAKELLEIGNVEYNRKEKSLTLTPKGVEHYEKYEELKSELESKIALQIGEEEMKVLKNLLGNEWGIN